MHVGADDLISDLRSAGLRITAPRRAVCAVLAASHDEHLTAEEIRRRAELQAGSPIDLSTIYRTLDVLAEVGRLHHVHLGHGPAVVHLSEEKDHHHLVCEICGRTVDVPRAALEDLVIGVERRFGFRATSVHFALVGRCADHADPAAG